MQHKKINTMILNAKIINRKAHNKPSALEVAHSKSANKEQLTIKEVVPEGYMTSEEFWKVSRESMVYYSQTA